LSRARATVYPTCDVAAVRDALRGAHGRRAVVVTDAVFSVDGDMAPLADLADVAQRHGATLIVDEAHSVGVLGPAGAGACAAAGVTGENLIRTFTLSKALGTQGGAVAAGDDVIEHLVNTARSFIFDTGLAPAAAGSALAATGIVLSHPGLPEQALHATNRLCEVAEEAGWPVNPHAAAVAALPVGAAEDAVRAQQVCAEAGVDIGCFRQPSVPDGVARLRMTGHANLSADDIAAVGTALRLAKESL